MNVHSQNDNVSEHIYLDCRDAFRALQQPEAPHSSSIVTTVTYTQEHVLLPQPQSSAVQACLPVCLLCHTKVIRTTSAPTHYSMRYTTVQHHKAHAFLHKKQTAAAAQCWYVSDLLLRTPVRDAANDCMHTKALTASPPYKHIHSHHR